MDLKLDCFILQYSPEIFLKVAFEAFGVTLKRSLMKVGPVKKDLFILQKFDGTI